MLTVGKKKKQQKDTNLYNFKVEKSNPNIWVAENIKLAKAKQVEQS